MSLTGYDLSQNWLNILVFIHVVAAIIGIGPVFFSHVLLRQGQTYGQLRNSLVLMQVLEKFPKISGSLAVVTGLLLAWLGKYGFEQFWIYGGIALYVLVQVVVIGFMAPAAKKVTAVAFASAEPADRPVSQEIAAGVSKANRLNYITSCLGVLLFLFMFFKPTL
jgi:uncharacterized membrane protein